MFHEMTLLPRPFEQIKMGIKTIEVRCNDEKRRLIKIGDIIIFKRLPNRIDSIMVTVTDLFVCKSFDELFSLDSPIEFGGAGLSKRELVQSMYNIYPKEREQKEGVLGIKIKYEGEKIPYKKTYSYGGIIFHKDPELKVLLIKHLNGNHWSFPKGHQENTESPFKTALREIKEETNLDVVLKKEYSFTSSYFEAPFILKTVTYFLAMPLSFNLIVQASEISEGGWFSINEALQLLYYDNDKNILKDAVKAFNH